MIDKKYKTFFTYWKTQALKNKLIDVCLPILAGTMFVAFVSNLWGSDNPIGLIIPGALVLLAATVGLVLHPYSEYRQVKRAAERKNKDKYDIRDNN